MPDMPGERLAALEAGFAGFKEAVLRRIDDAQKALDKRVDDLTATVVRDIGKVSADIEKLIWRAIPAVAGAIVLVWGTVGYGIKQTWNLERKIGDLERKMEEQFVTKNDLPTTTDKLSQILAPVTRALTELTTAVNSGRGASEPPGTLNILVFDPRQSELIRSTLPKITGDIIPEADKLSLGEVIKDPKLLNALVSVPDSILKDVPQLQATKFLVGNTNIVIARGPNNQVVGTVLR
jgi:hypothetical protein